MWITPFGFSLKHHWWRFIFLWLVSSCITGLVVRKAIQKPITGTTPRYVCFFNYNLCITVNLVIHSTFFYRLVYKWFFFIYKLSYMLGIISYVLMLATFFGLHLILGIKAQTWLDCALILLFYGLYFGVLGRDVAEICADKMASHIGVRT